MIHDVDKTQNTFLGVDKVCCLCGKKIKKIGTWDEGNNALPLKDGRCCDIYNLEKVIPARLILR